MARRPAATRFKWVRLPPAFLDRPTDESEYIFAKEPSDSKPSLADHNTKFNCLLGIHEEPKVAMSGDRLVNGAGVSCRRRGQSTISNR